MRSILDNVSKEIEIKRSKFICHLYRVDSIEDIKKHLDDIKKEYKDATHNCYAYICNTSKKASDDGEPIGTAGMPILKILESQNLDHVLAVVTRYFGGIKLGANGLIRAYADSVKETLKLVKYINLIKGIKVSIQFKYDDIQKIDYLLKDYKIVNKEYQDIITYIIDIPIDINIKTLLKDYLINYQELTNILIAKDED